MTADASRPPVTEADVESAIRQVVAGLPAGVPWCEPDGCPSSICGGPHYEHTCGEHEVTGPADPCPFCGWEPPDASLPPVDVQRPTPPLTDEELAALLAEYRMYRAYASSVDVPRLIADLRASRAEVERLREAVSDLKLNGGA